MTRRFPRSRLVRLVLLTLLCSSLVATYYYLKTRPSYALYNLLDKEEIRNSELKLKGSGRKYVKFKQLRGAGFNNQVQDILLYHTLALASSRTYVYLPFIWRPRGEESFVPLSAFLPGVTKDSISEAVFDKVCPEDEVKHVQLGNVGFQEQWDHAIGVLSDKARCIIVDDWIFNWTFLGTSGLHPVWPSFLKYLKAHFEWSQPILDVVRRNQKQLDLRSKPSTIDGDAYLALHLRRGDFEDHCHFIAEQRMGFTTWATLPELQPSVLHPPLEITNSTSVLMHCYPTLQRILRAVTQQAHLHPEARTLYVLHDGAIDHPLVYLQYYKLKEALTNTKWAKAHQWPGGPMKRVLHSLNVYKKWGEGDYAVAVDVELARRADGFIGNGYSSLSTQIVALRSADGGKVNDVTFV